MKRDHHESDNYGPTSLEGFEIRLPPAVQRALDADDETGVRGYYSARERGVEAILDALEE